MASHQVLHYPVTGPYAPETPFSPHTMKLEEPIKETEEQDAMPQDTAGSERVQDRLVGTSELTTAGTQLHKDQEALKQNHAKLSQRTKAELLEKGLPDSKLLEAMIPRTFKAMWSQGQRMFRANRTSSVSRPAARMRQRPGHPSRKLRPKQQPTDLHRRRPTKNGRLVGGRIAPTARSPRLQRCSQRQRILRMPGRRSTGCGNRSNSGKSSNHFWNRILPKHLHGHAQGGRGHPEQEMAREATCRRIGSNVSRVPIHQHSQEPTSTKCNSLRGNSKWKTTRQRPWTTTPRGSSPRAKEDKPAKTRTENPTDNLEDDGKTPCQQYKNQTADGALVDV